MISGVDYLTPTIVSSLLDYFDFFLSSPLNNLLLSDLMFSEVSAISRMRPLTFFPIRRSPLGFKRP